MLFRRLCAVASLILTTAGVVRAELLLYPVPPVTASPRYQVEVREGGGAWRSVFAYDWYKGGYAPFGVSGEVSVRVTYRDPVKSVLVRPSRQNIKAKINGKQITFAFRDPRNLQIEINGDRDNPLALFANPIDPAPPAPDDPNVLYFAGGKVHTLERKQLLPSDRKTIYIAPGAVVNGAFFSYNNDFKGGRIYGYGTLQYAGGANVLHLSYQDEVRVEGIVLVNKTGTRPPPPLPALPGANWTFWMLGCNRARVDNVKFLSDLVTQDGLDVDACRDVTVKNCYFNVNDDAISLKTNPSYGNGIAPRRVRISECVFAGQTFGSALGFGSEFGLKEKSDPIGDITFQNNDIIRMGTYTKVGESSDGNASVFRFLCDDTNAFFDGISLNDIWVEDPQSSTLFYMRVRPNKPEQAGAIRNVSLTNISVSGTWLPSSFIGFSKERGISNIAVKNLRYNGVPKSSAADAKFQTNEFVSNLTVAP